MRNNNTSSTCHPYTNGEFLIVACDGLWDVMEDDEEDFLPILKAKKTVKEKKEKKHTHEITLELLHEGKTLEEIAAIRQLSQQTISGHFVHLIKAEKIELEDVMEQERINELADLFEEKVVKMFILTTQFLESV